MGIWFTSCWYGDDFMSASSKRRRVGGLYEARRFKKRKATPATRRKGRKKS